MPIRETDWSGACTFKEYIVSLFEKKMTDSPEFKIMLNVYGRERLESIWKEFVRGKKNESPLADPSGDAPSDRQSTPQT